MNQDRWERTYGDQMRVCCQSIDALHDRMYGPEPIAPDILQAAADDLAELESSYEVITGDDYPDEMVVARSQLRELQEEQADNDG